TQRLYSDLQLQVLTSTFSITDFTAPAIQAVDVLSSSTSLGFKVRVGDDSGQVSRVVVLYAKAGSNIWSRADLTYDPATGTAEGSVTPVGGLIYYFVQATDPAGNVGLLLDHNNPFQVVTPNVA